ncbi:MAG: transposase [Thermoguttaceae bacterium]
MPPTDDPIAYFLTWPTYGTWLPGDPRGWVAYRRGWKLPDPVRYLETQAIMKEDACVLTPRERKIVEDQVAETCEHRGWLLHAVNCRSNHMHLVISAPDTRPRKVRIDIKAWCTRRLKEQSNPAREEWWAERGSQRYIFDEDSLATVMQYVTEAQAPQYHADEGEPDG